MDLAPRQVGAKRNAVVQCDIHLVEAFTKKWCLRNMLQELCLGYYTCSMNRLALHFLSKMASSTERWSAQPADEI